MDTTKVLSFGTLPEIYLQGNEKENGKLLRSYAGNYLKEEIKAEALVRNLDSFARFFLEVQSFVGDFVDYTKLAKRAKISRHAIPRYFEILEDTLVGYRINSFTTQNHSTSLDLIKHPKFYLFDNGVYNGLLGNFSPSSDRIGKLAEQLIFTQILHSAWSKDLPIRISSFRTRNGIEVDFVVELEQKLYCIEVRSSSHLTGDDREGLEYFDKEIPQTKKLFVFHLGKEERKMQKIWSLPWQKGIQELGL